MTTSFSWERFRAFPVVAILRGLAPDRLGRVIEALRAGGLATLEITMNTPSAVDQIRTAVDASRGALNVGAGTVTRIELWHQAVQAGASFIVTPNVQPEVIATSVRNGIPVFAGAFTPSEVVRAWESRADMVKVFPADHLGPGYIRRLKDLLPEVRLMPTGGVDLHTLEAYRRAGADGFGVGSPLFDKTRIDAGDWHWLEQRCRAFREAFQRSQKPHQDHPTH